MGARRILLNYTTGPKPTATFCNNSPLTLSARRRHVRLLRAVLFREPVAPVRYGSF
jgi:hypothetical protein